MILNNRVILPLLCLLSIGLQAETTMLYLEHAETLNFDEEQHPDAQILRGNVRFRHDDALMYCDSAYYYEKNNSLDAFGNVRFVQGDTLFGYGDKLYYDGNTRFARLRRNVRLVDKHTTLTTDSLNYDRIRNIAWYYSGGEIQDSLNTLTSHWGQYQSTTKQALFRGDVHLVNNRFIMDSDTLNYNTESHIADIVGETIILYEKETTIYSTLGWYNTETEFSMLLNHSFIVHTDGNTMTGDTIYYDKQFGFGKALQHIEMVDSANHITLTGHYGEMYEHGKQGKNSGFATDSALLIDWSDSTTYTYIHADTLFTEEVAYMVPDVKILQSFVRNEASDSLILVETPDTTWRDTAYRQIRGYYSMRLYREDMQAVGDSVVYNGKDSIISLYGEPILWSDNQQVKAEQIEVFMKNATVDYMRGTGNAIAIEQKHARCYNQMSGKEMLAYVRDGGLRQIDVNGNAETIFFPQEEDGRFIGVNKTQSSYVKIFLTEDSKIDHVVFTSATTGTMYPLEDLSEAQRKLAGFFWAEQLRPLSPQDVFRKAEFTQPEKKGLSAVDENTDENEDSDKKSKKEKKDKDKNSRLGGRGSSRHK